MENIHENKPTFLHSYTSVRSVFQNQLLDLKLSSLPQLAETILRCVWLGCREHGVGSGCLPPSPPRMESLVTSVQRPGQRQHLRCWWFSILPLGLHAPVSVLIQAALKVPHDCNKKLPELITPHGIRQTCEVWTANWLWKIHIKLLQFHLLYFTFYIFVFQNVNNGNLRCLPDDNAPGSDIGLPSQKLGISQT